MRIFKPIGFFARIITKPYKHISNDVKKGSRNIKADLNELKNNIKGTEKYNYIEAKDGKEAFEFLLKKTNGQMMN